MTYSKRNSELADPQCLREMRSKVEGHVLSGLGKALLDQVEDARVESIDGQEILACKMGGCTLRYLAEIDDDVLTVVDDGGRSICD